MPGLRLLPPLNADGPTQMAWDEALLEAAAGPTLRCYSWAQATVSLGYFQDYATVVATLPAGLPVVRRITGGGAIWHEHEVTYCLVGQLGQAGLPAGPKQVYPLLHGAVAQALRRHGAAPTLQDQTIGDRRYRDEVRCFASPAVDDVVLAGGKALGSAARTRGDRLLIHGSLKLSSNPWDQGVVAGIGLEASQAEALLSRALAGALGLSLEPGEPTSAEHCAMERIRNARYASTAWVVERRGPRP